MPTPPLSTELILGATGLALLAGLVVALWPGRPSADEWLRRRGVRRQTQPQDMRRAGPVGMLRLARRLGRGLYLQLPPPAQAAIASTLLRAGVSSPPERVLSFTLLGTVLVAAVTMALAATAAIPVSLAVLLVVAVPLLVAARVVQLAGRRRRAILDQLPILVDLMSLEQGGGGVGARRAIELVVARLNGEAASLLRSCLAASATAGTPQLDRQLERAAEQLSVPALSALAAVVRVQREEGVSTSSPLGQLARGLRDRQRDELQARGRRALVTMLLPVALCILVPFVLIILYPAMARLATAFS